MHFSGLSRGDLLRGRRPRIDLEVNYRPWPLPQNRKGERAMSQRHRGSANLTRRDILRTAAAGSALAASGAFPYAPALAQAARRDLRVGVFGGDFGNLSPVVRWDIQGGLVVYNIFDGLVRINYATR